MIFFLGNAVSNNKLIDKTDPCFLLSIIAQRTNIPVMVWIHGGAFAVGSPRPLIYDGRPLSAYNDVVVVSIQYRLNGFGFLTTGKNNDEEQQTP